MVGVRQFDESDVLEKALALFWRQGYVQTTMQQLAEATGVQRGSLYNAYGDKETLFLRAFELYRESYVDQMRNALDASDPRKALSDFLGFVIKSMTTGTPTRGCLSTKTAVGCEDLDETMRLQIRGMLDEIESVLHERFSREDAKAILALPAEQAAGLVLTMTRGLVVIERVYQNKRKLVATAEQLVGLLFPTNSRC